MFELQSLLCMLQVTNEPEDAEVLKARIETSVARYEAQFLPRRKRRLTTQQIRDFDAGSCNASCALHTHYTRIACSVIHMMQ